MMTTDVFVRLRYLLIGLLLAGFAALTMIPVLPTLITQGRDSGIFAYTGWVIAEGGVPYQDAWDNKLPLTYYANAAAFLLMGADRWAIWVCEWIFVALSGVLFYQIAWLLKPKIWFALPLTLFFMLQSRQPILIGDGNFTETYALLFQVMGFWAGYQFLREPRYQWGFWLGVASGLAFLSKQNTVAFALTFPVAVLLANHAVWRSKERWLYLGSMIVGGLLPLLLLGGYLAAYGALDDAIDAGVTAPAKLHEWVSIKEAQGDHRLISTIFHSLGSKPFKLAVLPMVAFWVIGLGLVIYQRRKGWESQAFVALEIWALLTFVLDMIVANVTHRAYPHYYLTPLPALGVLLLCTVVVIAEIKMNPLLASPAGGGGWWGSKPWQIGLGFAVAAYVAVLAVSSFNAMQEWVAETGREISDPVFITYLPEYVRDNTEPGDTVLVWGASSAVNFQSQRHSPTNFHYAYPLIVPDYTTDEQLADFIGDLERNRPVMIVDAAYRDGDRVPPLGADDRELWWGRGGRRDTKDLSAVFKYVADHCSPVDQIGAGTRHITIYRCHYE